MDLTWVNFWLLGQKLGLKGAYSHLGYCYIVLIYVNFMKLCICAWNFEPSSVVRCNYLSTCNLICSVMYRILFESLCKAVWADHLLGLRRLSVKLVIYALFFYVCLVLYFGCVTYRAVNFSMWAWAVSPYIMFCLITGTCFGKALSLIYVQF